TLREYATTRMCDDDREAIGHRHARFFARLAEEVEPRLRGPETQRWLDRLEMEHENLQTALTWYLGDSAEYKVRGRTASDAAVSRWSDAGPRRWGAESRPLNTQYSALSTPGEAGLRMAGALWRFWFLRGYVHEGRQWLASALV